MIRKTVQLVILFSFFLLLVASYNKWITVTPEGKQFMRESKIVIVRTAKSWMASLKKAALEFYDDVSE